MVSIDKALEDYVIEMRRHFHEYPEISLGELETQKTIAKELDKMGISYQVIAGTGIMATIEGDKKGKTVALRADIDALQVAELNDVAYKSKNEGIMHACGHDGHAAMLLGAAKVLKDNRQRIQGRVRLLFQPGEEVLQGAKNMIADGALEGVDAIYGQHLWNNIPCGLVNVEAGPRMASGDPVTIKITGKGGHGSMPDQTVDPIVVASAFIMNSNSIISRETSPIDSVVLTFGKMASGTRFNIIPETAEIEGSLRCFSEESRTRAHESIKRYADATAAMYGARAETTIVKGTGPVINHSEISSIAKDVALSVVGREKLVSFEKTTGSEDMSYYLKEIPGVLGLIGSGFTERAVYPHHHPMFDIDERALKIGTEMYVNFAIEYLNTL